MARGIRTGHPSSGWPGPMARMARACRDNLPWRVRARERFVPRAAALKIQKVAADALKEAFHFSGHSAFFRDAGNPNLTIPGITSPRKSQLSRSRIFTRLVFACGYDTERLVVPAQEAACSCTLPSGFSPVLRKSSKREQGFYGPSRQCNGHKMNSLVFELSVAPGQRESLLRTSACT